MGASHEQYVRLMFLPRSLARNARDQRRAVGYLWRLGIGLAALGVIQVGAALVTGVPLHHLTMAAYALDSWRGLIVLGPYVAYAVILFEMVWTATRFLHLRHEREKLISVRYAS